MSDKHDPNYEPTKIELLKLDDGRYAVFADFVQVSEPIDVVAARKRIYDEAWAERGIKTS